MTPSGVCVCVGGGGGGCGGRVCRSSTEGNHLIIGKQHTIKGASR